MLKCIIVEDEPTAQTILNGYITRCPDLSCDGIFADAFAAKGFLDMHVIDLIFLDVNLPGMSGISFLQTLIRPPRVILSTAYSQYAVEGFNLEVVDYLLKPYSFERFLKAVNKAKIQLSTLNNIRTQSIGKITIKADKKLYPIELNNILYIEANGDYVTLFCVDKKITTHGTMKEWEERLSNSTFQKIHRSIIVNIDHIKHIDGNSLCIRNSSLSISAPFKSRLLERLESNNVTPID